MTKSSYEVSLWEIEKAWIASYIYMNIIINFDIEVNIP